MITLQAQLAKKLPIPGSQFSSKQASITITAEVTDLSQILTEAHRLYALAEQAVDLQLSQHPSEPIAVVLPTPASSSTAQQQTSAQRPAPSQPYRSSQQRRGPAPITDSQLRFITRLIDQTKASLPAILEHHQVGSLDQISCKAAVGLIDELKAQSAPS